MNILAIDSALNNSYIAFLHNGKTITQTIESDENYHSLYLISKIKETMQKENMLFDNFDAIAVNTGHGSFTGIRVALTVAKIMAQELNLPLIPLNTTEILLDAYEADYLVMDARRDMYYIGDKKETKLILKNDFKISDLNGKIVTDKRLKDICENKNLICFEEENKDIAKTMLKIAQEKLNTQQDFNYLNVRANYIQTPPVF